MNPLRKTSEEYKKYKDWGYTSTDAAKMAVDVCFAGFSVNPHIYMDEYGEPSHIFYDDLVLFFPGDIYIINNQLTH